MDSELQQSLIGGSVANGLLVIGYLIFKFIQQRCKKSHCESHNSCFECSTDLEEIKETSKTVRDINHKQLSMLEQMMNRINEIENRSRSEIPGTMV